MDNSITTQSGERLSFFKLFDQKQFRVLIPIIQRDYAQGRKSKKEVRNSFLNALYDYLNDNKPNRDLDFVYGSLRKTDQGTDFIPLDGQQRLTTLFLLHWYLYQISDNTDKKTEFKNALLKNGKSMFLYETRRSSTDFCEALMDNDIEFDNLLFPDKDSIENNSLSKTITNKPWFYLSWQYDPTIQSMLTMLDAIHQKFNGRKEFFERLSNNENPVITFLFLNLREFQLTDDLYIKMNSRGKPLTSFENFKAKFEQYLEKYPLNQKFFLEFDGRKNEVSLKDYFSYNIDTKWADLFWNYHDLQNRSNTTNDNTFDDELMNFIRVIFTNQYAMNSDVSSKDKDDGLEYLLGTQLGRRQPDYSDVISFSKYDELKALTEDGILFLIDAFDSLANGNKKIKLHLSDEYNHYFDENKVFENALKHNFESNHQRLCFHAYIRFLIQNKNDVSGINQWMRVIYNLSHPENTVIDSASDIAAAITSIEHLLPHSNNILNFLKKENTTISLFSSWQVLEEKIKAHLITKSEAWKNKIEEVEKHKCFNGQIGFILEFAGIKEYYNNNKNCNWNDQEDTEYFKKFSDYSGKASIVFDESYENRVNDKDFVFERAVLTKGDYLTTASQNRKNLLSTSLTKNNIKRDHSWKRLLRISNDKDWPKKRLYVKQVFDDERFDSNNLESSLETICKDRTDTWRDYFISCPALIDYCQQGFIRFDNENTIRLYKQSQSNFPHAEMYTYYLWKNFIAPQKEKFKPCEVEYKYVRSIQDYPGIVFCFNRIGEIALYYCNDDKLPNPYEIAFKKSEGENHQEEYDDNILKVLDELGFEWDEDYNGYFNTFDTSEKTLENLKQLNKRLKEIMVLLQI
jgi:hypothetical protein